MSALADGFETLAACNGRVPTSLPYDADYLKAVHRECVRELHGILGNCHVPRGEQWLSCSSIQEAGICLDCANDEKRREYDNNLVLLIDDYGYDEPRVALVRHQRDSKRLLVKEYCKLEDVLGYGHSVVEKIRHVVSRGYAPAKPCAVLVGYVGDLVTPMAACYMHNIRAQLGHPGVGDDEDDDLGGFEVTMIASLSTGHRTPVRWPVVDRERVLHLNDSQYGTLDSLSRNVELIKGPPGTGKSTLIDALVRECVVGDDAVCVTAVQNRAVEALAIKFAAAKTPFITCGTRACDESLRWTLKAQVERDAGVVLSEARLRACERLRTKVRARVARAMAKIYRPLVETEDSERQRIRERRERQLVANPSAALRASMAYGLWEADHHGDSHTNAARRALAALVEDHMKHLDPWRRAATALVRARMPLAHEFLDTLAYEVERAQYALDKAREAATDAIARGAKVLLCTTATVGVAMRAQSDELGPLLARLRVLVCDEAGTLADRHIVPVLAAAPVSRLVLVGDPAQLPCFTHVRGENPTSAMQRLLKLGMPSAMLTQQYRMPPALCNVVSAVFYDDQLVTAEGRDVIGVAAPIRFLAVPKGRGEMPNTTGRGGSIVNREEVRVVVREAERLRGRYPTDLNLAILATYAAQRNAIAEALGDGVAKVLTVDSAQGQEFDHVIYSHVASDPRKLGFTKNANRLCVALSRAKRALVVVAHPSVVAVIPALKAMRAASFEDGDAVRRTLVAAQRDAIVTGVHHGANTMRVCAVCQDPISNAVGYLECDPPVERAIVHALCPECAEGHLNARLEADDFDGRLCCPCAPDAAGGCLAPAYEAARIARVVSVATFTRFNRAVVARHEMAVARQLEADFEERVAARVAAVTLGGGVDDAQQADRAIADDVVHIIETILTLRCPTCNLAFVDFDACALLQCRCGVKFCGFCLRPNATHDHVAECRENPLHGRGEQGVYVTRPEWERAQHQRKQRRVRAHLADATQEHRAAVLEHLRPHGIDIW